MFQGCNAGWKYSIGNVTYYHISDYLSPPAYNAILRNISNSLWGHSSQLSLCNYWVCTVELIFLSPELHCPGNS